MKAGRLLSCVAVSAIALGLPGGARADGSRPDSMAIPPDAPLSYTYDAFEQGVVRPLTRSLDLSLLVRRIGRNHREAADLDAQDRVLLPSTWWQPRIGFKPVSVADMLAGPGPGTGPAPGPWTVVAAKAEGVSKGFTMQDSAGVRFAIKFDAPSCSELATSADVVASKLYWAAGYNVPDNTIAFFRREDLVIAPDATRTVGGAKLPLTAAYVDALLRDVPQQPDGSYRVVASRFLKGKPLGEWRYDGRRKGDQEDRIPHQLRREIRGLWAINAWINHTDCSARNTLDMYVTDGGRSFVRHHLIDFSGCLGSASITAQPLRSGHEYWVDGQTIATSLVTLALPPFAWEHSSAPALTGLGFIDSKTFDPGAWRPYLANPAFDECTLRDIQWGARIVAAFTNEHIRAAVEQGRYSDPRTTEYLVRVLEERRDKIVRRWLTDREPAGERSVDLGAPLPIRPAGRSSLRPSSPRRTIDWLPGIRTDWSGAAAVRGLKIPARLEGSTRGAGPRGSPVTPSPWRPPRANPRVDRRLRRPHGRAPALGTLPAVKCSTDRCASRPGSSRVTASPHESLQQR